MKKSLSGFKYRHQPLRLTQLAALLCSGALLATVATAQSDGISAAENAQTPAATVAQLPETEKKPTSVPATATPSASTTKETMVGDKKDIVLDNTATPVAPASVAVIPVPATQPTVAEQAFNVMQNQPPKAQEPVARRTVLNSALADLGLHLLRANAKAAGNTQGNVVVSPQGVASTLAMLHAGAVGQTASELAGVLEPGATGGRLLSQGLKDLTQSIQPDASAQWQSLNRLWVDTSLAANLSPAYTQTIKETVAADGVMLGFSGQAEAARTAINQWASDGTQGLIPAIVPAGVLKPTTRMVLTNANYFKGEWVSAFKATDTKPAAFFAEKQTRAVPTMHQTLTVREGLIGGVYVMELPFKGGNFTILLAMPHLGHTIQALEADLMGADIASWQKSLQPQRVMLALPKFEIAPTVTSLNQALQSAGVTQAFNDGADFSGMLKQGSKALKLDDVLHSAGIKVNEDGTVAASATAAVMGLKSISIPPKDLPLRQFNRPFVFALVHSVTGAPLFMGRVTML